MKSKRILALLVVFAVLCSSLSAFAAYEPMASTHFNSYYCYVVPLGGGEVEVHFEVYGTQIMTEIGASQIILQESANGLAWSEVKTYTKEDYYDDMIYKKTSFHVSHVPAYEGEVGMYYRAVVTFYAHNGTTSATRQMFSDEDIAT